MLHRKILLDAEEKLTAILAKWDERTTDAASLKQEITGIRDAVSDVAHSTVDYQQVIDQLDDGILIADKNEKVIYINEAYSRNTGIPPEEILGRRISDILAERKYFTAAAVPDIIRTKKKVMKLSSMHNRANSLGIVMGFPIFDNAGEIDYAVAFNRNISSYSELHGNFTNFVDALKEVKQPLKPIHIYNDSASLTKNEMVGSGKVIERIHNFIENVATTDATVMITGESGVGKELVAEAIYQKSNRAHMPFIKINCASIPAPLLESELFGYEKGAFSGANDKGKKGLFEAANAGTLLLDEIGDMPIDLQAKLLRVIQNNEVTRVGGITPISLNIRLIASTNCDLKQKIKEGTFRNDLYYRLHVIPINVPPLRERREDIPHLCRYFLNHFSKEYNKDIVLTAENIDLLANYAWPGNIRELRNVMEYITVCTRDKEAVDNELICGTFDISTPADAYSDIAPDMGLNQAMEAYEKEFIRNALKNAHNLKEAGEVLNVDASTVSRKLKQYGLSLK